MTSVGNKVSKRRVLSGYCYPPYECGWLGWLGWAGLGWGGAGGAGLRWDGLDGWGLAGLPHNRTAPHRTAPNA